MDYILAIINEVLDKLLEAKGWVLTKRMLGARPKPKFKNNIIKFKDLQEEWKKSK